MEKQTPTEVPATLGVGVVRWWKCRKCGQWAIPVDTRILRKQQLTECHSCGEVYKYTYKGARAANVGITWHADLQDPIKAMRRKAEDKILRVEKDDEGYIIAIKQPNPERLSPEAEKQIEDMKQKEGAKQCRDV